MEPDLLRPGDIVGGSLIIVRRVGRGAFGEVYQASDKIVSSRQVAIKILKKRIEHGSDEHESSIRELKLLSKVWHPSIVQLAGHGLHDGRLWFSMPWISGSTLADYVRDNGPLSRADAESIFMRLAEALTCLHMARIRHQDIKPGNILITSVGGHRFPVLIDFGVGAMQEEELIAGTPAYIAPEVARALAGQNTEIGTPADVFSLGLTLLHSLDPSLVEDYIPAAKDPFLYKRGTVPMRIPRARSIDDVHELFEELLSHQPNDRPKTVSNGSDTSELARALSRLTARERRRRAIKAWLPWTGVLVVVASVVVVWLLQSARERARLRVSNRSKDLASFQQQSSEILLKIWSKSEIGTAKQETKTAVREGDTALAKAQEEYSTNRIEAEAMAKKEKGEAVRSAIAATRQRAEEVKKAALEDAEKNKKAALEDAEKSKKAALEDAEKNKKTALEDAEENKKTALEEAEKNKKSALEEVEKSKKTALEEAEKNKKTALEDAEKNKKTALEEAEKNKRKALEDAANVAAVEKKALEDRIRALEESRKTENQPQDAGVGN
jgi:serine/threonine protein kinase